MALVADINALGNDYIRPELEMNWSDGSSTLKAILAKRKMVIRGGLNIRENIIYNDNETMKWYTGAEEIPATQNSQFTQALYGWKQLGGQVVWTGTDLIQNDSREGIINYVKALTENALESLKDRIATAMFNAGTVSKELDGFQLMFDSAGQYPATTGGISPADYAGWSAKEDSATTTLTRSKLQQLLQRQIGSGDDYPDLLIMRPSVWGKLYDLVAPIERWQSADEVKLGTRGFTYNGTMTVQDTYAPGSDGGTANNWLLSANTKYIRFYCNSHENMKLDPVLRAFNQNLYAQKVLFGGALTTSRRNRQAAFQTIDPAL